jgi:purine-cytosine permease-like protein
VNDNTDRRLALELSAFPEKRGPVTMGLLWITMVTIFPCVLIGVEWQRQQLTLGQVMLSSLISCAVILLYTVPVTQLAARTGLGYSALNYKVFGASTAKVIAAFLSLLFPIFYGFSAFLLAEGLTSIFHWSIPVVLTAFLCSLFMAVNNYWGFSGIANFARFLAAPVLIFWVFFTFFKVVHLLPTSVLFEADKVPFSASLTLVSSFVIGVAVWGNEADYWRHGTLGKRKSALALACALAIGQLIFPITGWLIARYSGIGEAAAATAYINEFCFGALPVLGAVVLFASYFAGNDSNLFGSALAIESVFNICHKRAIIVQTGVGTLAAILFSSCNSLKAIEVLASLNCVLVPMPTIIVLCHVLACRMGLLSGGESRMLSPPRIAQICLSLGVTIGIATSGVLPGTSVLCCGIPSVQTWFLTGVIYFAFLLGAKAGAKA